MNKELEEAKQKLEKFVGLFYEFPNPTSISIRDYEVEAIKTVLNYIENSIPKKRIEEVIKNLKKKQKDRTENIERILDEQHFYFNSKDFYEGEIAGLQETDIMLIDLKKELLEVE